MLLFCCNAEFGGYSNGRGGGRGGRIGEVDVMVAALGEVKEMDLDTVNESSPPPRCERDRAPYQWKGVRGMQIMWLEYWPHRTHHRCLWGVRTEGVQSVTRPADCHESSLE